MWKKQEKEKPLRGHRQAGTFLPRAAPACNDGNNDDNDGPSPPPALPCSSAISGTGPGKRSRNGPRTPNDNPGHPPPKNHKEIKHEREGEGRDRASRAAPSRAATAVVTRDSGRGGGVSRGAGKRPRTERGFPSGSGGVCRSEQRAGTLPEQKERETRPNTKRPTPPQGGSIMTSQWPQNDTRELGSGGRLRVCSGHESNETVPRHQTTQNETVKERRRGGGSACGAARRALRGESSARSASALPPSTRGPQRGTHAARVRSGRGGAASCALGLARHRHGRRRRRRRSARVCATRDAAVGGCACVSHGPARAPSAPT